MRLSLHTLTIIAGSQYAGFSKSKRFMGFHCWSSLHLLLTSDAEHLFSFAIHMSSLAAWIPSPPTTIFTAFVPLSTITRPHLHRSISSSLLRPTHLSVLSAIAHCLHSEAWSQQSQTSTWFFSFNSESVIIGLCLSIYTCESICWYTQNHSLGF